MDLCIISHRANIDGPNSETENNPDQILKCIDLGYDVEVDLWYSLSEREFYLGHDNPEYQVDYHWIKTHKQKLWIHCKNIDCLYKLSTIQDKFNYFWHQEDDYTLTSKNFIWTYPGKSHTPNSVIVMPERNLDLVDFNQVRSYNVYGVCTDYPSLLRNV